MSGEGVYVYMSPAGKYEVLPLEECIRRAALDGKARRELQRRAFTSLADMTCKMDLIDKKR